ncbi:putative zinc finger, CCHC-type [Heracleum sosnowskyi]|uniref:Zinc finger, CCHC-type n=1 Tax=Heracleum sosnowskyi TaxID=360622 RepID=A0AAD8IAN4_9APIA|nr:putative zinc finger, CCHC-type [Heracleum sosnowskyi]
METNKSAETSKTKEGSFGLSYPMLTKSNYTAWAQKMKVFMQAHGVWEAIESKDPKAVVDEKADKRALAIIYQGIPDDVLLALSEKKTSKAAWEAIKILFQGSDKVRQAKAQTLRSDFEALKMKDTDQIEDFCMRLNGLVTNIRALGEKIEEAQVVRKLLRAVPTKFLQIASAIEQFGNLDDMSIEEVIGSLRAHEERLQGQTENAEKQLLGQQLMLTAEEWQKKETSDGKLLLTREEWLQRTGKTNTGGGGRDHRVRDNRIVRDRSQVKCFNCLGYGHYAAECRKTRAKRGEVNLIQARDDEPALLMAMCDSNVLALTEGKNAPNSPEVEENTWYLDNGASNHMTGNREKFESLDRSVKGEVKFGDGSLVKIEGKGSIRITCKNGETRFLQGLYFIPTLRSNIISLGQLSEEGNRVVIDVFANQRSRRIATVASTTRPREFQCYAGHVKASNGMWATYCH